MLFLRKYLQEIQCVCSLCICWIWSTRNRQERRPVRFTGHRHHLASKTREERKKTRLNKRRHTGILAFFLFSVSSISFMTEHIDTKIKLLLLIKTTFLFKLHENTNAIAQNTKNVTHSCTFRNNSHVQ